jgi:hypothetical protein
MRRFACRCGRPVYFDNHRCTHCHRELAFDPEALDMRAEEEPGDGLPCCANRLSDIQCNWMSGSAGPCLSCRMSKIIPVLSKPENRNRWRKLEAAKRRLLYELLRMGLPVDDRDLHFVFKEDRRTNPDVGDDHVLIGHAEGVITINAAEADEVYREQMRQALNEPVRTLLGHFRHESGHYYFGVVVDDRNRDEFRARFGNESADYDTALNRFYAEGPRGEWWQSCISAYASAHPSEDWAETWAHYLHIRAVLEVAESTGLTGPVRLDNWREEFVELIINVNELLRSLGLPDAYPFVITDAIAAKIEFVHRAVMDHTAAP